MSLRAPSLSMTLRGSLRLRLLLGTLVWIAASIMVAGWALGGLFRQHVAVQFHAELKTHLDQLAAHLVFEQDGRVSLSSAQSDPRFSKPYSGVYWQIDQVGQGGKSVVGELRSRSLWDDVLEVPPDTPMNGEIHQHRVSGPGKTTLGMVERLVSLEDSTDQDKMRFHLIVAADERQMLEPVERFNGMLWLALGLLGGGLALVAVIQVLIALVPLRRLHGALAAVRSGKTLDLEGRFPGEVQPLVEEFNTVLAQNAEVVERARTQAGNLAHALKTPLSVMANAANGKDRELAHLVSSQVEVARKQIDYHLSRSRAAASVRIPGVRTPVFPVLEGLVRVMKRIHADRNFELAIHPSSEQVIFCGEEQDLQEMLGNLLDNACKWARRRVEIAVTVTEGYFTVTIGDDGCGIAPSERERVCHRGERTDELMPGSGLGLAIVNDLVRLYGGSIELGTARLGGLQVALTLPVIMSLS